MPSRIKVSLVISFPHCKWLKPSEIYREVTSMYGKVISQFMIYRWCREFNARREQMEDLSRPQRPESAINDENVSY